MRRVLAVFLILGGLGLFALLVVLSNPVAIWKEIQSLPLFGLFVLLGNELGQQMLWILSWLVLLRAFGIGVGVRRVIGAGFAGYAVSYITPIAYLGGEPVRAWLIARDAKDSLSNVVASLFVDRLLAGLCVMISAVGGGAVALAWLPLTPANRVGIAGALGAMALLIALGLWSFAFGKHWLSRLLAFPARFHARLSGLRRLAEKTREVEDAVQEGFQKHFTQIVLAFLLQVMSFILGFLRPFWFFGLSQGRWLSPAELGIYASLSSLVNTLFWLTPAGVGVAEGGRVGILGLLGIGPAQAMAFSLTIRFAELCFVAVGLLVVARVGLSGRFHLRLGWLRGLAEVGNLLIYSLIPPQLLARWFSWRYRRPDPWDYAGSPYEAKKYEQELALLPRPPYRRALELGCSEGLFTCRLARDGWAEEVVGVDFVPAALDRARARCRGLSQVSFYLGDIRKNLPPGKFDLILCSELLYYLRYQDIRRLARRLVEKLLPRGHMVLVSAWPAARVFHRPFLKHPKLRVLTQQVERHPTRPYVISVLERSPED